MPPGDEITAWARIKAQLSQPSVLASLGTIGIGLLCWKYSGQLMGLAPSAAAAVGSRLVSPKWAAKYTIDKIVEYLSSPDEVSDHILSAAGRYIGLVLPMGNMLTVGTGNAALALWRGVSAQQSFAIAVFKALPNEWRNEYLRHLAVGLPKVVGALALVQARRFGEASQLYLGQSPW